MEWKILHASEGFKISLRSVCRLKLKRAWRAVCHFCKWSSENIKSPELEMVPPR